MSESTQKLSDAGVSIWLDDLSRERLTSGNLAELIKTHNVVGVTTNPTIFAGALSKGAAYAEQMRELAAAGASVEEAVFAATCDDVRAACDVFAPVYKASNGFDGRVSIEVDPRLARDAEGTAKMARELYERVGRENVMIKIPATQEGLRPIAETLAAGISVNVTLIFSLTRYREVINAYMLGLEQALENGKDLSTIHSVASFFVSRVDTEIDARLEAAGGDAGQAGGAAEAASHREGLGVLPEGGGPLDRPLLGLGVVDALRRSVLTRERALHRLHRAGIGRGLIDHFDFLERVGARIPHCECEFGLSARQDWSGVGRVGGIARFVLLVHRDTGFGRKPKGKKALHLPWNDVK